MCPHPCLAIYGSQTVLWPGVALSKRRMRTIEKSFPRDGPTTIGRWSSILNGLPFGFGTGETTPIAHAWGNPPAACTLSNTVVSVC